MTWSERIIKNANDLQKLIILLANTNDEPIKGNVKLQKMMFLLSDRLEEIKEQSSYDADNYGPYSEIITNEVEYLEDVGVLARNNNEIELTKEGKKIAKNLNYQEKTIELLNEYKEFLNDMTDDELLTYIYCAYPNMVIKSVEYQRLQPHMESHILSLIKKEKISLERAAELLDKSYKYILEKIKDKHSNYTAIKQI